MTKILIAILFLALSSVSWADDAPVLNGTVIKTKVPMKDQEGKIEKNGEQRRIGVKILQAITVNGQKYEAGMEITDPPTVQAIVAYVTANNLAALVAPLDPDCAKCDNLTLGWIMAQAMVTRVCVEPGKSEKSIERSIYCTPDEERLESNPMEMWSRQAMARQMMLQPEVTLGPNSVKELKMLIAARFGVNPALIAEVFPLIDPNIKQPPQWGTN